MQTGLYPDHIPEFFWAKVDKCDEDGGCWLWKGGLDTFGYGRFWAWKGNRSTMAHRVAYELTHGVAVPEGLTLDHLCGVTMCVNPEHLEPVTPNENSRRRSRAESIKRLPLLEYSFVFALTGMRKAGLTKEEAEWFEKTHPGQLEIRNVSAWRQRQTRIR